MCKKYYPKFSAGYSKGKGGNCPPPTPPGPVESDKSGVDGFAFFRLGYFGYSDLQSSATFIFKVGFLEPYLMTIIVLIITLQSLQIWKFSAGGYPQTPLQGLYLQKLR